MTQNDSPTSAAITARLCCTTAWLFPTSLAELDINGELNKLAFNISFGHGIHAGIHFRSSTFWSILLGEQMALSVLDDRVKSYNEPFTISITKFDGTSLRH